MSDKAREFRSKYRYDATKSSEENEAACMQAFADQEVKERIESLTDEVIEKEISKEFNYEHHYHNGTIEVRPEPGNYQREEGAKWAREYLKQR